MFFPNDIFSYDIFSQDNFSYWHFFLKTFFPKTFFPIKHFFLVTFFPCDIFSQVLFFPKWHFFLILRYFFLLIFPKIFIRKSTARRTEFDFANDLAQLIFQNVLKDFPQKFCWDNFASTLLAWTMVLSVLYILRPDFVHVLWSATLAPEWEKPFSC